MDVEKGCLNRCDTCSTGCDSVSYDEIFTVFWKKEHERPRGLCFKAYEYEGIFARRGKYLFSCSDQLDRLVLSMH
jgi:hypothetical protein